MKQLTINAGKAAILAILIAAPRASHAQFLRLGPFDFNGLISFDIIYETNVDGVRQTREVQQSGRDPGDLYYVAGFQLSSSEELPGQTRASITAGLEFEKHPDRPDLDDSTPPLGNVNLSLSRSTGPYTYFAEVGYMRETEAGDQYIPGGGNVAERDPNGIFYDALGFTYTRGAFGLSFRHDYERERHFDPDFAIGDKDTYGNMLSSTLRLTERVSLRASAEHEDTLLIQTDEETVEYTYFLGLDFTLLKRPKLTYSFGFEKEDTEVFDPLGSDGGGEWDPIHVLSISDQRKLSATIDLSYFGNYEYDPDPRVDEEIGLTYGVSLAQKIDERTTHSLTFMREPVDTFGSTTDTDQSTITYAIIQSDFLLHGVTANLSLSQEHSIPVEGPTEDIFMTDFSLIHQKSLTRRIDRKLSYEYSREDSNLEDLTLEQHIFTLGFTYEL